MAGRHNTNVARTVGTDSKGNCYVSAMFENSAVISTCSFSAPTGNFLVKISPSGNCLWGQVLPYYYNECFLTVDKGDAVIVSTPDSIIKYTSDTISWVVPVKELKGNQKPWTSEVHVDQWNNIYFMAAGDSIMVAGSAFKSKSFLILVKLKPNGALLWAKPYRGPVNSFDVGNSIFFSGGAPDWRVAKYSLNGDSVWCKYIHVGQMASADIACYGNLVAITGALNGCLMNGGDTVFKSTQGPMVAVFEDIDILTASRELSPGNLKVSVYPNPVAGILTVKAEVNSEAEASMTNVWGLKIYGAKIENGKNYMIDVNDLPGGLYFITVTSPESTIQQKIIIEKN
jgi:hypothetical protein